MLLNLRSRFSAEKNLCRRGVFLSTGCLAMALWPSAAWSTPAQISGQAGVVGDYQTSVTAKGVNYQAVRVPFSLTIEGKASSKVSLFLNLSPNFTVFPGSDRLLGNNSGPETTDKEPGKENFQPLSPSSFRNRDVLSSSFAYLQYSSDIGLLTLGRAPRHWGLGLWRNARWSPEVQAVSTSDMVGLTMDFSASLSGSVAFEKMNEGSPVQASDDAEAFTVEAILADDPSDPASSGLAKRIGLAFSSYRHGLTDTSVTILDMFGQFYLSSWLFEGEFLYPTGETKSLGYDLSGGDATKCEDARNPGGDEVACESRTLEGFAALLRTRWLVAGGETTDSQSWSSLAGVDAARRTLSTALTPESHEIGAELGFARGDTDSFRTAEKDKTITGVGFHPNIRPSLIMFGPAQPLKAGFPGALVQNVVYAKVLYQYETPGFGLIAPSLLWAQLHKTAPAGTVDQAGLESDLGFEFNLDYAYRTTSRMDFGVTAGVLFAGDAYSVRTAEGKSQEASVSYGVRTTMSTSF
jgi:hypothetical protein